MGRIEDLLLLEKAGELPVTMQKDLDTLRAAGEVPAREGSAPASAPTSSASAPEPGFFERQIRPGGFFSPEAIGTAGGGIVGGTLGGLLTGGNPAGVYLGAVGGAGVGAGIGRGSEAAIYGSGSPVQDIGEASQRGMEAEATGAAIGAGYNSAKAAIQNNLGRKWSFLPEVALARRTAATERAATLHELAAPEVPSQILVQDVKALNPQIELEPIREAARGVARGPSLISEGERPFVAELMNTVGDDPYRSINLQMHGKDQTSFQSLWATIKTINEKIGVAKNGDGADLGVLLQLKRGLWDAMDKSTDSVAGEAKTALKAYNMAFRNELAVEKTAEIIANATRRLEGREGDAINTQAGRALDNIDKALRKDKWLEESFPPGALDRIREGLEKIRSLPSPGAAPSVDAGTKRVFGGVAKGGSLGSLIGGAIGYAAGGVGGGAMGAGVGTAVGSYGSIKGAEMLTKALAQPKGIDLVERMLKASPAGLTPVQISTLAIFVRGSAAETKQAADNVKNAMKTTDTTLDEKIAIASERSEAIKAKESAFRIGAEIGAGVSMSPLK